MNPDEIPDKASQQTTPEGTTGEKEGSFGTPPIEETKDKDRKTLSLADLKTTYGEASKKVSENVRQYALAGIGIIWVFRGNGQSAMGLDPKLLEAALWIIVALGLDLFQYILTTYIWFGYFRVKESKNPNLSQEFLVSDWWNSPNYAFFTLKIIALFYAYVGFIIPYVLWRVHH